MVVFKVPLNGWVDGFKYFLVIKTLTTKELLPGFPLIECSFPQTYLAIFSADI